MYIYFYKWSFFVLMELVASGSPLGPRDSSTGTLRHLGTHFLTVGGPGLAVVQPAPPGWPEGLACELSASLLRGWLRRPRHISHHGRQSTRVQESRARLWTPDGPPQRPFSLTVRK